MNTVWAHKTHQRGLVAGGCGGEFRVVPRDRLRRAGNVRVRTDVGRQTRPRARRGPATGWRT